MTSEGRGIAPSPLSQCTRAVLRELVSFLVNQKNVKNDARRTTLACLTTRGPRLVSDTSRSPRGTRRCEPDIRIDRGSETTVATFSPV